MVKKKKSKWSLKNHRNLNFHPILKFFLLKMLGRVPKFEKNNKKILIKYLRLPNELNFHKNV